MIEPSLTLDRCCTWPNSVTFSDETGRSDTEGIDAIASVTLEGPDSSWGEFMTRNDLLALRAWIDRVLGARALPAIEERTET
jgi:hypothetical protein